MIVTGAPSAPGNPIVSGTPTTTSIALTWTPSPTAGIPAETYTLFCMPNTATTCDILKKVGISSAVNVPRTTVSGTVTGLSSNIGYKCCVQAKNTVGSTYNALTTSATIAG